MNWKNFRLFIITCIWYASCFSVTLALFITQDDTGETCIMARVNVLLSSICHFFGLATVIYNNCIDRNYGMLRVCLLLEGFDGKYVRGTTFILLTVIFFSLSIFFTFFSIGASFSCGNEFITATIFVELFCSPTFFLCAKWIKEKYYAKEEVEEQRLKLVDEQNDR